jgi:hypothetical protein
VGSSRQRALLALALALVAGCGGVKGVTYATTSTPPTSVLPLVTSKPAAGEGSGRPECDPPTRFDARRRELRGTTQQGDVWGLVLGAIPAHAGERVKIVWRVTGAGPLRVTLIGPRGRPVPLESGPTPHGASTFNRPGDEWGTIFRFDRPGCWQIHLARRGTTGDVFLPVLA